MEQLDEIDRNGWTDLSEYTGKILRESLDRSTRLRVIRHESLTAEKEDLADQTLDTILWWFESTDRLDPVGVLMLRWNLRKLQIRFDHMIRTLEHDGVWLVVRETRLEQEDRRVCVSFYLLADTLARMLLEGTQEHCLVCVPTV